VVEVTAPEDSWTDVDTALAWSAADTQPISNRCELTGPASLTPMLDATFEPDDEYDDLRPSIRKWLAVIGTVFLLSWLVVFAVIAVVAWVVWFAMGVVLS
jgi:hypothetical protein